MRATDLLAMTIRWQDRGPGTWFATVGGVVCTLEMNDFPEEPLYTVRVGDSSADMDDAPKTWTLEGLGPMRPANTGGPTTSSLLRFTAAHFGAAYACRGPDIATVVAVVCRSQPQLTWYAAHGSAQIELAPNLCGNAPVLIGDGAHATEWIERIEQFLSAVFIGASAPLHWRDGGVWSESPEMETDGLVEIRAFDTTCVELRTRDSSLLVALAHQFQLTPTE